MGIHAKWSFEFVKVFFRALGWLSMVESIYSMIYLISIEKKSMGNEVFNAYRTTGDAFVAGMIMTLLVL